ncbi:hypothetical protein NPX13_g10140 [Xylaria arbuscula]|uniref:Cytochrome P450 n=1 Tax=Xylaria arbuscula TaxID=114810 RepID=A0A9W8N5M4_9PEZI|nr:hypothetical protein NPX13_g10140 [Xylaria arbuscula]
MRMPTIIICYSVCGIALLSLELYLTGNYNASMRTAGRTTGSYATGLLSSIILYRRYFHRLKNFPGPPLAGITKLWHVWKSRDGKNHLLLEELFSHYGPIIRTGPEELTVIDAAIPDIVDGSKSQMTKATFYDVFLPMVAISATRNVGAHDARRRVWSRAFSPKAMAGYEDIVLRYTELLTRQIESLFRPKNADNNNQCREAVINVTDWFAWYAFDIMGEFAFSRSFNMLRDEKWHAQIRVLVDGLNAGDALGRVPWLAQLGKNMRPRMSLLKDWESMMQWCSGCMNERLHVKGARPDLTQWLIDAYLADGARQEELAWLHGDAVTIILAGSGTVSVSLTFAFYQLAKDPSQQQKLFDEIKDVKVNDRAQLQNCRYLTAFINETLRLYPPVPTAGNRMTPPQGVTVNNQYIPGGITIVAPKYLIHRLESSYEEADQFIPERWTTRTDMVKENKGFAPFSQGKYGCIGKPLAMMEMRIVICMLLQKFEIGFQDNDAGEALLTDLEDHFTFAPGDLRLSFRLR